MPTMMGQELIERRSFCETVDGESVEFVEVVFGLPVEEKLQGNNVNILKLSARKIRYGSPNRKGNHMYGHNKGR